MDDVTRIKMSLVALGALNSVHENLDKVRDYDKRLGRYPTDLDHNIEQAQVALETAFLRIQQAKAVIEQRSEG